MSCRVMLCGVVFVVLCSICGVVAGVGIVVGWSNTNTSRPRRRGWKYWFTGDGCAN